MGKAVVHMMKIGKGGSRGIQSHNQREKESHKNPDIDKERTHLNYDLMNPRNINYNKAIKDRIEVFAPKTKTVRKDAIVMCNFIITSDEQTMKTMSPEQQQDFFEETMVWSGERYGHENLVNATVHLDETTPHMYLGVVPIIDERLSAKTLFDRKELISLQTDFVKEVGAKYGLERGKEGSERTHLSEERFKLEMAKEKLKIVEEQGKEIITNAKIASKTIEILKSELPP